jgi:hypothetical protein
LTIDALAKRLQQLLDDGSIPASSLSKRARKTLAGLFDAGILSEEPSGAGRRVVVRSPTGLKNWVATRYPHGLHGRDDVQGRRAAGVANLRDSKRGGGVGSALSHLRGFGDACLRRGDETLPVAEMTRRFGAASLLVDADCDWKLDGRICAVENLEVFLCIEKIVDDLDLAIFTHGRFSQQVIDWLADYAAPTATILHAGDYDPVGLAEYLRLKATLGERVRLFIPPDFEDKLSRYGNRELLRKSRKLLATVRASDDPQVRRVVDLIDEHGRALEQEALLIGMP